MNDFVLFPDGTWCYESDLPNRIGGPYNGYIKVQNPFKQDLNLVKAQPAVNKFVVISWEPSQRICPYTYTNLPSGELKFTATHAVLIGDKVPLIQQDKFSFYDVLVTDVKFEGRQPIFTGMPYWVLEAD